MKKLAKFIIPLLLILAVVAAIATNPSKDDYCDWCIDNMASDERFMGTVLAAAASAAMSSSMIKNFIQRYVNQKDYILFSIFEVGEVRVLGIFGRFFDISEFYK